MAAVSPLSDPHSSAKFAQYWVGAVGADVPLDRGPSGDELAKKPCRGMIVGTAGSLVIEGVDGESQTIVTHTADLYLPIQATALIAAGSTCEDITVFW